MSRRKNPYTGDARTRAAKQQGFPARSVFKLDEIDRRVQLFCPGQRVLDLGAAPGSWSMYASRKVGPKGVVVAVDLSAIRDPLGPNVEVIQGDATRLSEILPPAHEHTRFDVVLSDMAPATSGNKLADQTGSFELFMAALEVATTLSGEGASFVGKLFMGPDYDAAKAAVLARYAKERTLRPRGTRQVSSEVFLVGSNKRS